jgi:hypothetical protein
LGVDDACSLDYVVVAVVAAVAVVEKKKPRLRNR